MTFRGTKTVPDGEGIRTWQRLGAAFGTDTNAFTNLTRRSSGSICPRAIRIHGHGPAPAVGDVSSANFDPKLVDIERKVVTAERALRQTPLAKRIQDTSKAVVLAGTRAANADIGGTHETRPRHGGSAARFLQSLVSSRARDGGDRRRCDAGGAGRAIRRHFGDWTGQGTPPAEPDYGKPVAPKTTSAIVTDPQAPNQLALNWVTPHDDRPDTPASESADLTRAVAVQILSQRLARKARDGASFLGAARAIASSAMSRIR